MLQTRRAVVTFTLPLPLDEGDEGEANQELREAQALLLTAARLCRRLRLRFLAAHHAEDDADDLLGPSGVDHHDDEGRAPQIEHSARRLLGGAVRARGGAALNHVEEVSLEVRSPAALVAWNFLKGAAVESGVRSSFVVVAQALQLTAMVRRWLAGACPNVTHLTAHNCVIARFQWAPEEPPPAPPPQPHGAAGTAGLLPPASLQPPLDDAAAAALQALSLSDGALAAAAAPGQLPTAGHVSAAGMLEHTPGDGAGSGVAEEEVMRRLRVLNWLHAEWPIASPPPAEHVRRALRALPALRALRVSEWDCVEPLVHGAGVTRLTVDDAADPDSLSALPAQVRERSSSGGKA